MNSQTLIIPLELSDGTIVKVEATPIGEKRVSFRGLSFSDTTAAIKGITHELALSLKSLTDEIKPGKLSIRLGLDVTIESGHLTTLIVKGSSKANFEIIMEWMTNRSKSLTLE
jgi:hypothetical protein